MTAPRSMVIDDPATVGARLEPKVRAMLRMSPEELRELGARLQAAVEARRDEIAGLS